MKPDAIISKLKEMFPNARCELDHKSAYELTVAVMLSAQTTDKAVNKITPTLFSHYPTIADLAKGSIKDVEEDIKSIGLYHNKAKNLILMSQGCIKDFQGVIPNNMDDLCTLAGIGRKSANVILSEWYHIPALAVDTHVERVSKRLGLVKQNASVLQVEKTLMKKINKEEWINTHHLLIFFGRYFCKAIKPSCLECPFKDICKKK